MFYLIERHNQNKANAPTDLLIQTVPGRTNMSGEECIEGWLGTTNNVYEAAHGEYATLGDAIDAAAKLGYTCRMPRDEDSLIYDREGEEVGEVIAVYRTPEDAREQWAAADWLDPIRDEIISGSSSIAITANTTDTELDAIAADLEADANSAIEPDRPYGATMIGLDAYLREIRSELREEA